MMIRRADPKDVDSIIQVIHPDIDDFAVDDAGREKFSRQMLKSLIENPDIHYFVYQDSNEILGVIAYREPAHLVHFFVHKDHQGKGVGRQLWQHISAIMHAIEIKLITVNSSVYAE